MILRVGKGSVVSENALERSHGRASQHQPTEGPLKSLSIRLRAERVNTQKGGGGLK